MPFLMLFLLLFVTTGIGNGSTFRMIPMIFESKLAGPVLGWTSLGGAGRSLVVCGLNDIGTQCLVNAINQLLGNYGTTLDVDQPSYQWQSDDGAVQELLEALRGGQVNALLITDAHPGYSLPDASGFIETMKQVPLTVSFSTYLYKTAVEANFVCPVPHPLESWNDAEPVDGILCVSQPAIRPLGETRSLR